MGGSSGGGGGASTPFPTYQHSNMGSADYNATAATNTLAADKGLYNIYQQANQSLGYIPQSPSGYNPQQAVQQGQNVLDASQALPLYGMRIADLALDPQNATYNSLQRQALDQTRSRLSQSGLANTPYGAGIEGANQASLATNWENNKLNRALQGGQAISELTGRYGDVSREGIGLQASAPLMQMQVSQGLSGLYGNFLGQQQQAIDNWLRYLGQGSQANAVGVQAQSAADSSNLQARQLEQQRQQQQTQNIMQGVGMLGGLMGK
jgi:hypothetical protein